MEHDALLTESPQADAPQSLAQAQAPAGLLILHGNRLEWLLEAVLDWLQRQPLPPLEEELLLVQSNGIAEWLKRSLAERSGICAATRVELPARFLWRCYRAVLGPAGVPRRSPLDEAPLVWRLMRCLPQVAGQPDFEPLAQYLAADDSDAQALSRRLQLAQRLADLYDEYQVYRADWLQAWASGDAVLIDALGRRSPLPAEQRWQARLWQQLCGELSEAEARGVRSEVHARAVAALQAGEAARQRLPRRVVVFGLSHLPQQALEALQALAGRAQVLLALPNPCRYHWSDIIEGRELLAAATAARRRHPLRGGVDLAALPLEQAHAQAHPLLAAWGRQARDFIRLLDRFDDTRRQAGALELPRVDLFDDAPGDTLLQQLQARIRDNLPAGEALEGATPPPAADRSIAFHIAHSAMREVEVLHDQLLHRLAPFPGEAKLAPRQIVVMLPDIEPWAPLIHAVFGRHGPGDARRIPYEIADLRSRERAPLLRALEWLLRVDAQRCTAGELRDLLEVPAVARRFGLDALGDEGREVAARWLAGAGVRWGLDAAQREQLGLGACGEANTWRFGLRRMLLGYAVGLDGSGETLSDASAQGPGEAAFEDWQDIAPYGEVGGLESVLAGSLALLVDALGDWWARSAQSATPADWGPRCQALLQAFFTAADEGDRLLLARLNEALSHWLDDCEAADFDERIPLAVLREAWLGGVDDAGLRSRFLSGGVLFCTLMPMRAIPFELVCLLGMNDGDYPRRAPRSDFDLIGAPGQRRPGDRARRDDDRLLMLEALLAARRGLYVSWAGRNLRDNSPQPPSVLVAQLRDAIAATWGEERLAALTTEHPLQPFSRRYFEAGSPLVSYAREWRAAHPEPATGAAPLLRSAASSAPVPDLASMLPLNLARLEQWLRRPVAAHWRERLGVVFTPLASAVADDEPLALDALDETLLLQQLVAGLARPEQCSPQALQAGLERRVRQLARRGELPLGALGERWQHHFQVTAEPMLRVWAEWMAELPQAAAPLRLSWVDEADEEDGEGADEEGGDAALPASLLLDDWLDGLRQGPDGTPVWLQLEVRRLASKPRVSEKKPSAQGPDRSKPPLLRPEQFVGPWLRLLAASAQGQPLPGRLIGRDVVAWLTPPAPQESRRLLRQLLAAWRHGLQAPLPVALYTAMAWLKARATGSLADADEAARQAYDGGHRPALAEAREPALARCWPEWEQLAAAPWQPAGLPSVLREGGEGRDEGAGGAAARGAFDPWVRILYAPLYAWVNQSVRAQWLEGAAPEEDDGSEDGPWEDDA
ncbi:MAG: exodeoxyribonuclease V subunit gamma [Leptothrix sp. (in: Bacteria)]|nr:exodeoxyribonuclease V subunit gamma [Leptothrix sp. (in: b-proteobacteria)]